jgi:hypothetical protein
MNIGTQINRKLFKKVKAHKWALYLMFWLNKRKQQKNRDKQLFNSAKTRVVIWRLMTPHSLQHTL